MTAPWSPVVYVDMAGSVLMLALSGWSALLSWRLTRSKPDNVFRSYLFLFSLAILFFAISRSFGHLVKQLLLMADMGETWAQIAPFSGAINSAAFVVIFAFGISFHRFQTVHAEIEYYKGNLEALIASRTAELEASKNTLENILDNSNPINITTTGFELVQANRAYYELWPKGRGAGAPIRCYESRPGAHCDTDQCPLRLIAGGEKEVVQEVSKKLDGETRDFIVTARPFRDVDGRLIGMVESFQDITLHKRAEKALRESEERFRKIFESNPDPVILARLTSGEILDVNRAFENVSGLSRERAVGRTSAELGLWKFPVARTDFLETLEKNKEISNYEAVFLVGSGAERTGLVSASVLTLGQEPCLLLVIRDITTEKEAEEALRAMNRMKSEFISTAAHELKTPLSTIMGYTEFLRTPEYFGGFTDAQKAEFVNEVYENSEALNRIIEDLLDISRIEGGKPIPLVLEETDIPALLRKKLKVFMTHDSRHAYLLELPDQARTPVLRIDRQRVSQALENLLSNAMKYSPPGTEVVLSGRELADGWEISVEDHGIGMTGEQLGHIFDKFYRADASDTATRGLGLGMSIVKHIIEAHRGSVRVESTPGKGTIATITLPFTV